MLNIPLSFFTKFLPYNSYDLNITSVSEFVLNLLEKHRKFVKEENVKNIVDEISENIFILLTSGKELLSKTSSWKDMISYITEISLMKASGYPSLSNKTIFKFMDILETI